jgi:GntR family transcriptional regulator
LFWILNHRRGGAQVSVRRHSPLPLYYQIREILREEITSQHMPLGAPFPTETQLMQRFGVSRTTVRKAVDGLVTEGLVHRVQGQGTFVSGRNDERELLTLCSLADVPPRGRPTEWRVIRIDQVAADERVARNLQLEPGTPVTYIERLHVDREVPIEFGMAWLPDEVGQTIVQEDLSLYLVAGLLEDRCGVRLGDADCTVGAVNAEGSLAQVLQVAEGTALLIMERTDYTVEEAPILFHRWYVRADRIGFAAKLRKG